MPLILTQNEVTVSGHVYADELGLSYEYPKRYRSRIVDGERFIYYRGRRSASGGTRPQAYLGHGRVGEVGAAPDGRLRCAIEAFVPFPSPLFFKTADGYLEPAANAYGGRAGLYFRTGVRVVPRPVYDRIVALGTGAA